MQVDQQEHEEQAESLADQAMASEEQTHSKAGKALEVEAAEEDDKENKGNAAAAEQPSRAKFDKFKEQARQKEALSMRNAGPHYKVDSECDIKGVSVYQDYSCKLTRQEVEFTANSRDTYLRMQLLERNDRKKWFLWIGEGKLGKSTLKTKFFEFFNTVDGVASFEKKFLQQTENTWAERDYFQPQFGKFVIGNVEREKQKIEAARQTESEILEILERAGIVTPATGAAQPAIDAYEQTEVEPEIFELLQLAWDLNAFKQAFVDANLDIIKLPLGTLSIEKIKKSFTILGEISKVLLKGEVNAAREQQIIDHTDHFYQTLPYDFGIKRPVNIDHLRRVRDKVKLIEQIVDITTAEKCLLNALVDLRENRTVQVLRNELLTNLKPMGRAEGPDSALFDAIYKSVQNTTADLHKATFTTQIRHVFHSDKPSQKISFRPFERRLHNKFLLWFGCRQSSVAATLRDGLKLQSLEQPSSSLRFGKGIYLTDCFSKAASQCLGDISTMQAGQPKQGVVFLVEVALGDMHWAYQPEPNIQLLTMTHSVYGVGAQKPDVRGLIDLRSSMPNFALDENAQDTKSQLFFHTGKMRANSDLPAEEAQASEQRFNDFVVFDSAQVKLKYAVMCDFFKATAAH